MKDEPFATAFSHAAEEYERGRPGYPKDAIDWLVGELGLKRGSAVIDLGAGTGKLTTALTAHFARVIAVEPLDEMRALLARTAPAAEALKGTAERIPLPDASADAVFVAQAFHWFDGRRALDEIARVLSACGGLALLWNTTPWELREGPWFARLDDLLERSRADLSTMRRHASGVWRKAFAGEERFSPLAEATFDNTQRMSRQRFLAGLASRSYIARLSPGDRRGLLDQVADLLDQPDAPIANSGVIVPMRTDAYRSRLRDV
jgi:ubiquinone/menaquinone biosynthesis C-methylase UbiE